MLLISARSSQNWYSFKGYPVPVPTRLKRYYDARHLHFITCSRYHRLPNLGTPRLRDLFLKVLEQARRR